MNPIASKAAQLLRNGDGTINWKLIGILGLGVAALATIMQYRAEKKREANSAPPVKEQ